MNNQTYSEEKMSNSRIKKALSFVTALALTLVTLVPLSATTAMAQATTGTLTGTVADPQGGAISNAKVTAKNQDTGVEATTTATGEGNYNFPTLLPGKYTLTVEQTGFKRAVITDIDVRIGTENRRDVALEAGAITETVTVTAGGAEEVAQTTSQISSSFESRKVEELPSNAAGGGIDTLALLAPGVVPGFGNVNSNGALLSVNGNRARSNNFTLDGTDNNDLNVGGPSFFISNQDSVQEFQVITNNYTAQYGRNQGAIINIVTKGGTNEFHGSGFEFHRNSSSLDAMTNQERADPGRSRRDKFISNVFGGTFGGPIVKNKAFFFVDGQLIRQRQQLAFQSGSPAITRAGLATLSAAFPGNPAIAALVNQSVFALQPTARARANQPTGTLCFPRDPTLACTGANAVVVPVALSEYDLPLPFDQKEYGLRGDFNPTSKDAFNAKYRFQKSPETGFNSQSNGFIGDIPFTSKNLNGSYTRQLGSSMSNEFRAAWQKLGVAFAGCSSGTALTGCIPGLSDIGKAFTNITFTGVQPAGLGGLNLQSIGPATNIPQGRTVTDFQISDNFSWTRGRHTMLFGGDFRHLNNENPFLPNFNGAFRFSTTARLVANAPTFVTIAAGEPVITYKENDKFFYFQDDYKVRDNLTLNLGLRYENTGQPINTLADLTTARESNASTALFRQNVPLEFRTVPRSKTDNNNWAPRVGFAYSPRWGTGSFSKMLFGENDATVIRGGYSIAYEPAFYNILLNVSTSAPNVFNNTINNNASLTAPTFRLPANPTGDVVRTNLGSFLQKNTFDPRLLNRTKVGDDFHAPYSEQWSFGVQRQFNKNNVAEIRYVGNRGIGLFQTVNRNPRYDNLYNGFNYFGLATLPSFRNLLPAGTPAPVTCVNDPATADNEAACQGRLIAGSGLIRSRENTGKSSYNGLQARYNGRLMNEFTVGVSYTFSKTLDTASEIFAFGENAISSNPFDVSRNERGLSGNDRRHATAINLIWDVPFFKSQEGFAGKILGGWQVNAIYNLASGRPYTPSQFLNTLLGNTTYQDNGFTNAFFGLDSVRPFVGNLQAPRTSVGISDIDTAIFYSADFVPSPTGFYDLSALNNSCDANGDNCRFVPVSQQDVRYIVNLPGAVSYLHNPFGNVLRNSERGPALNQLNMGFFKNTKITENVRVQFRAELFNALNHPNPGYGVAGENTLPDTFLEDAGVQGSRFAEFKDMTLSSRRVQLGLRIIF
jgi:outer membrane receptor protein involved in Fe transport